MIFLFIVGWLACGVIGTGWDFAYWESKYPNSRDSYREDLARSLAFGFAGPIAMIAFFFLTGFGMYGWRLWRKSK